MRDRVRARVSDYVRTAVAATRRSRHARGAGWLLALTPPVALAPLALLPAADCVAVQVARAAEPGPTPQARGLTGGLARLRSPGSTMIRIAASSFAMGSTDAEVVLALAQCQRQRGGPGGSSAANRPWPECVESRFQVETPRHRVRLSSYWLDRTEVTKAAYDRCVRLRRCSPAAYSQGAMRFSKPRYPVSLVSWQQAAEYCRFRGSRLPTEAEFERAARGVVRRNYPWGNLYNSHACNHGRLGETRTDTNDGFAELAPVGSFPAGRTPDGLLDLAGNVSEWVTDWFAVQYEDRPVIDPTGPPAHAASTIRMRVLRGGDYESAAPFLRGAARSAADPTAYRPTIGFRCARSARAR
jgi:sulfatase modifying factor 1